MSALVKDDSQESAGTGVVSFLIIEIAVLALVTYVPVPSTWLTSVL